MSISDVGLGILTVSGPLFITEIVPPHVRGRAVGLCVTLWPIVSILATTLVWRTEKLHSRLQYRIPLAIQVALAAIAGCLTFWICESPTWHLFHDRPDHAKDLLMKLRGMNEQIVLVEIEGLKEVMVRQKETQRQTKIWDIFRQGNLKRTLTAGAYQPLSMVSGSVLAQTYSTVILVQSGVVNAFEVTILISCLLFLGQICGLLLVDEVGRRPLVLCGLSVLCVLNIVVGCLAATSLESKMGRTALVSTFITFSFFMNVTFGSM